MRRARPRGRPRGRRRSPRGSRRRAPRARAAIASSARSLAAVSSVASSCEAPFARAQISALPTGCDRHGEKANRQGRPRLAWADRCSARARNSRGARPPRSRAEAPRAPRGLQALDLAQLLGRVVRDPLADRRAAPSPPARTSTASPAPNSPSHVDHADRQQARALLAQRPLGAGVDEHRPREAFAYLSHSLKLDWRRSCGMKRVPTASPATARASVPGRSRCRSRPVCRPTVAISAASTLLRIPPDPRWELDIPISYPRSSSRSRTSATGAGIAVAGGRSV